jgi:hypothetical protein
MERRLAREGAVGLKLHGKAPMARHCEEPLAKKQSSSSLACGFWIAASLRSRNDEERPVFYLDILFHASSPAILYASASVG